MKEQNKFNWSQDIRFWLAFSAGILLILLLLQSSYLD